MELQLKVGTYGYKCNWNYYNNYFFILVIHFLVLVDQKIENDIVLWLTAAADVTLTSGLFVHTVKRWCEYKTRPLVTQKLLSQAYPAIRIILGELNLQGSVTRSGRVLRLDTRTAYACIDSIQSIFTRMHLQHGL